MPGGIPRRSGSHRTAPRQDAELPCAIRLPLAAVVSRAVRSSNAVGPVERSHTMAHFEVTDIEAQVADLRSRGRRRSSEYTRRVRSSPPGATYRPGRPRPVAAPGAATRLATSLGLRQGPAPFSPELPSWRGRSPWRRGRRVRQAASATQQVPDLDPGRLVDEIAVLVELVAGQWHQELRQRQHQAVGEGEAVTELRLGAGRPPARGWRP